MDVRFPERCGSKMCISCGALMPTPALKCTACNSFQDWRRYLPFDATILALLTALASVLTTGAPAIIGWARGGYADLSIDYDRDDQSGGIILTAFNAGTIPAHIKKITLKVPLKNAKGPTTFDGHSVHRAETAAHEDEDDYFIAPNTHKLIKVTFDLKSVPPKLSIADFEGPCVLHYETDQFHLHGKRKLVEAPPPPPDAQLSCDSLSVVGVQK
jgi:hypothetical protein